MSEIASLSIGIKLTGFSQVKKELDNLSNEVKKPGVEAEKSFKKLRSELNAFSRDLGIVANEVRRFGLAITGTFAGAFLASSKEIPLVNKSINDLKDAFQEVSNTLAQAALPALNDIINSVRIFSNTLKQVNPALIEQVFRFGAWTVAITTAILTFRSFFRVFTSVVTLLTSANPIVRALTIAVFALIGAWNILNQNFPQVTSALKQLVSGALKNLNTELDRTESNVKRVVKEFQSQFKGLRDNMLQFSRDIANSLDTALGDTIFQAITGRIKGLRSILLSFKDDILRAFSRGLSNTILGFIFGNAQGGQGLMGQIGLGGIGSLFGMGGRGNGGGQDQTNSNLRGFNQQVQGASENLQFFQTVKDQLINKMLQFHSVIEMVKQFMVQTANTIGNTIAGLLQFIVQGFGIAINNIISFSQALFSILSSFGGKKGGGFLGGLLSIGGAILGNIIAPGIGGLIGGALGGLGNLFGGGGGLPSNAGISFGNIPQLAEGGIVTKPTLAVVGESGAEAVVPLDEMGDRGNVTVILQGHTFLNDDAQVDRFVRQISDGLLRSTGRRTGGTTIAL